MLVRIEEKILERYPEIAIGYLVAHVNIRKTDPFVEQLKKGLSEHVRSQGIHPTNYVLHPHIRLWRQIYEEDFGVNAKTYRSSIEALLRRVVTGKEIWNICNVVDLYNCCSVLSLLPMGGYDLHKIHGNITIRYAQNGETFLGLGERVAVATQPNHVVYADEQRVLCWLWNHKDSADTCIATDTKAVLFFIDGFEYNSVKAALEQLSEHLQQIGCNPLASGILNRSTPLAEIISRPQKFFL